MQHSVSFPTYTDQNIFVSREQKDLPSLVLFSHPSFYQLLQFAVLTTVLPKDDQTNSFQEEPLILPNWTLISAICVLEGVSIRLVILTLEF